MSKRRMMAPRRFTEEQLKTKERERHAEYYITHKHEFIIRNRKQYDKNRGLMSEKYRNSTRISKYLYKYGITPTEAESILNDQNGLCAICNNLISFSNKTAHTDHDHTLNEVRGILCSTCNMGLGSFKDDITTLFGAINYLRDFRNR